MTVNDSPQKEAILRELNEAVSSAVAFFREVPEDVFDGTMTAREVVSHLLFWHEEYVEIAAALWDGQCPIIRQETFAELSELAARKFRHVPYQTMLQRLCAAQQELNVQLRQLPDWRAPFPIKKGVRRQNVTTRLAQIVNHIERHVQRMERAQRHGEDWVRAYYSEAT